MKFLLNSLCLALIYFSSYKAINKESFSNWDSSAEEALSVIDLKKDRIYIDGPRPFFIQRSLPESKIFYDLNTRFQTATNIDNICLIEICFKPDLWVFGDFEKDTSMMNLLKSQFSEIVFNNKKYFISRFPVRNCQLTHPVCDRLRMSK